MFPSSSPQHKKQFRFDDDDTATNMEEEKKADDDDDDHDDDPEVAPLFHRHDGDKRDATVVAVTTQALHLSLFQRATTASMSFLNRRRRFVLLVVASALVALCLTAHRLDTVAISTTARMRTGDVTQQSSSSSQLPALVQELGWIDTIELIRMGVGRASQKMYEQFLKDEEYKSNNFMTMDDYERYTVDITPYYNVVVHAINTVGVKGLLFEVFFEGLQPYYGLEEDEDCMGSEGHGYMCAHYGFWWFYHFTGSILAERLILDKRLLWDPTVAKEEQKYVYDFFDLQERIHIQETLPYSWEMSIHVQHGLLWHYANYFMPNMTEFPTQLMYDWCGRWVKEEHPIQAIGKRVGFSCVHGFGHMVFYLAARHQIDPENRYPINAKRQILPMSGFELNHLSICRIQQICVKAEKVSDEWQEKGEDYSTSAGNRCKGGAVHSMKLMLTKATGDDAEEQNKENRKAIARHFNKEHSICEEEAETAPPNWPWNSS